MAHERNAGSTVAETGARCRKKATAVPVVTIKTKREHGIAYQKIERKGDGTPQLYLVEHRGRMHQGVSMEKWTPISKRPESLQSFQEVKTKALVRELNIAADSEGDMYADDAAGLVLKGYCTLDEEKSGMTTDELLEGFCPDAHRHLIGAV